MRRPTLLLADDHTVVVEGLRRLLEPHFEIVASVDDGRELLAAVARSKPDVILLDISMPGLNGIDAALSLKTEVVTSKIVFLTMYADSAYVNGALRAGASGYVLKRCASAELVDAIHQVLEGRTYITPQIAQNLSIDGLAGKQAAELTPREREVLQLIAEGHSAKEIAARLNVSPKTVVFHKSNIAAKLGIHDTAGLTKYAMRHGIADEC